MRENLREKPAGLPLLPNWLKLWGFKDSPGPPLTSHPHHLLLPRTSTCCISRKFMRIKRLRSTCPKIGPSLQSSHPFPPLPTFPFFKTWVWWLSCHVIHLNTDTSAVWDLNDMSLVEISPQHFLMMTYHITMLYFSALWMLKYMII